MAVLRRESERLTPTIRVATLDDLDDLLVIERGAAEIPWSRRVYSQELLGERSRLIVLTPPGLGHPVSFIGYWVDHDEAQILNLATLPEHRRRGYAQRLMAEVIAAVSTEGARYISLEVRRRNQAALGLYRRFGYRVIGVRPGYYTDFNEDALMMLLACGDLQETSRG